MELVVLANGRGREPNLVGGVILRSLSWFSHLCYMAMNIMY